MKVFLITSTRADFGLLKNLIINLIKDDYFQFNLIATGSHFSKKHGYSVNEIKYEKLTIHKKIILKNSTKSPIFIIQDMGTLSKKFSFLLLKDNPDLIIILGDRYEIFTTAYTAYISKIPVAHISGGEKTVGSLDDGFRHCISKLSGIHFVANQQYKKRLIQLGEHPKNIFNVGSLGAEAISKTKFFKKKELSKNLKIIFKKKIILVCLQPELTKELTIKLIKETLDALDKHEEKTIIFTMPGVDLYNHLIINSVKRFVAKRKNCYAFKSLGSQRYLSLLKLANLIVGNSSSGISEMPKFKKFTINIGNRQKGRMRFKSIIDVPIDSNSINQKINFALSSKKKLRDPYGNIETSKKIISIIKKLNLENLINKEFYDLERL